MTRDEATRLLIELTAAFPSRPLTSETAAVWRAWLMALPLAVARQAIGVVCVSEDFPTIHQVVAACGITSEPVKAMLVAAKDGGYELVRDPQTPLGWRSSRDALPEPPKVRTPMPADVRAEIEGYIGKLAEKRVPAVAK